MKGYKGFEKGLACRGKQYAENTVFEEQDAVICKKGMHFCASPFDVLDYYKLLNDEAEFNDFAEVEALDDVKTDDHKKYCTKKLRVGAKLSFSEFVRSCVDYAVEKRTTTSNDGNIDDSALAASGDYSQLAASGENSVIAGIGINNSAKAKKGCWITLAEWKEINGKYTPVCVKTELVDGVRIKENTYYKLKNGEFVEV